MSISKFISIIMHPIFMPFATIYLSIKLIPVVKFAIAPHISFIYLILILSTIILPLISVLFLINQERISSEEITIPVGITILIQVGKRRIGEVAITSSE